MTARHSAFRLFLRRHVAALLLLVGTARLVRAQTYDWTNANGGPWQTAGNWNPAGPPPAAGTARFSLGSAYTVSFSAGATVNILTLNQGDVNLNLNGNSFTATNTVNGGIATANATGSLRVNNGTITLGQMSVGGSSGSNGTLVLDGVTTATVGSGVFFVGTSGTGALNILNFSTLVTSGTAGLGLNSSGVGTATVNGNGASWTVNGPTLKIGSSGNGTVNVLNGATMSVPSVDIGENLGSFGKLTLNGLNAGFSSAGTVNVGGPSAGFPAASATLNVGTGATANFNAATNLRTTATVNLTGGTLNLNTLAITPGAVVNWTSGKVQFANASAITSGVLDTFLGGSHVLGLGRTLAATAGSGQLDTALEVNGGTLSVPALTVNAPLVIGAFGAVSVTDSITAPFEPGKSLTVEDFGTLAAGSFISNNGGIIQPEGLLAAISCFVANNYGLVQGTGRFLAGMNNGTGGTIRARSGDYLIVETGGPTNSGRIELSGGTIEYAKTLSNLANGSLSGRGEFRGSSSSPGGNGLSNLGMIALSGGLTDIRGDVINFGPGRIIASGGAIVTLYDDLKHSGAEFKVSEGSTVVCFGLVSGTGTFTGNGALHMEGGYAPGASPASITIAPEAVFADTNALFMELGGTAPGSQHDKLTFTSSATSQVTWGGTLDVKFINGYTPAAGDAFDLFDFDPSRAAGMFAGITLPVLPPGLVWDSTALYATGVLTITPELIGFADWAAATLGDPFARPYLDHDGDGWDNLTEFALGLFPPQPATVLPDCGFHTYSDGEHLRVLFTRPLDRGGLTLKVQAGSDLVNWTDLAVSVNSAPFTGPGFVSEDRAHPPGEPGLVEVRDFLTSSSARRRQMRIMITEGP